MTETHLYHIHLYCISRILYMRPKVNERISLFSSPRSSFYNISIYEQLLYTIYSVPGFKLKTGHKTSPSFFRWGAKILDHRLDRHSIREVLVDVDATRLHIRRTHGTWRRSDKVSLGAIWLPWHMVCLARILWPCSVNLLEKLAQVPGMSRKGKQMYTRTLVDFTLKGHTDPPQPNTDPLSGFAQN